MFHTPQKTNMEPENEALEEEISIKNPFIFRFQPLVFFGGVSFRGKGAVSFRDRFRKTPSCSRLVSKQHPPAAAAGRAVSTTPWEGKCKGIRFNDRGTFIVGVF